MTSLLSELRIMDLWQEAIGGLDPEIRQMLQSPGGNVNEGVKTLIGDIEKMKAQRDKSGWTVTLPGIVGGKPKIINLRNTVYSIMEAAFEFNDIVTQVLEFDPTKYGIFARLDSQLLLLTRSLGALAWSVVSFSMNVRPLDFPKRCWLSS